MLGTGLLIPAALLAFAPVVDPLEHACPEGQFLELSSGLCFPLVSDYGYEPFEEPPAVEIDCDVDALREHAQAGGVTIRIPEGCTLDLGEQSLTPGDGVVIEGAGVGSSTIQCRGTYGLRIHGSANIVVRDVEIDGLGYDCKSPLHINDGADNVLVERVLVHGGQSSGVGGEQASRVTVRYSRLDDTRDYHGIGVDDGYVSVAFYSNYITNTGEYGIDSHASRAEIAGNYLEDTHHGLKVPDARDLLLHHNWQRGSQNYRGIRTYMDKQQRPQRQLYWRNTIDTAGEYPFRFDETDMPTFIAGNSFGDIEWEIAGGDAEIAICEGSDDEMLEPWSDVSVSVSSGMLIDLEGLGPVDPCALVDVPGVPVDEEPDDGGSETGSTTGGSDDEGTGDEPGLDSGSVGLTEGSEGAEPEPSGSDSTSGGTGAAAEGDAGQGASGCRATGTRPGPLGVLGLGLLGCLATLRRRE